MPKDTDSDRRNRPFRKLGALLEKKKLPLKSRQPDSAPGSEPAFEPKGERQLFKEAMDGVVPIRRDTHMPRDPGSKNQGAPLSHEAGQADGEALAHLQRLVATGEGFHVADTPEYREGVGPNVPSGITRHLHKGQFSIQDHIDLHGLRAAEAEAVLQDFFKAAVAAGKRAVLIVHGRGLSSPKKPVLKAMVHRWLETGPWRHWVMAYSSARACDGGAGATYVLLRGRPLTKRFRKKRRSM
jgi:DNA-nicking Smr family endonuclease